MPELNRRRFLGAASAAVGAASTVTGAEIAVPDRPPVVNPRWPSDLLGARRSLARRLRACVSRFTTWDHQCWMNARRGSRVVESLRIQAAITRSSVQGGGTPRSRRS